MQIFQVYSLTISFFSQISAFFDIPIKSILLQKLSFGIKPEFIGFTAHNLFVIKMYNCDFYLNKSSLKSSKFYFLF